MMGPMSGYIERAFRLVERFVDAHETIAARLSDVGLLSGDIGVTVVGYGPDNSVCLCMDQSHPIEIAGGLIANAIRDAAELD